MRTRRMNNGSQTYNSINEALAPSQDPSPQTVLEVLAVLSLRDQNTPGPPFVPPCCLCSG